MRGGSNHLLDKAVYEPYPGYTSIQHCRAPKAHLDLWVRVADSPAVVGDDVGHAPPAKLLSLHLAQLVGSLLLPGMSNISNDTW